MKPKPLFLLPPVVLLVLSGFIASLPGEISWLLILFSMTCILPIGFSAGWTKYTGIALWFLFLAAAASDESAGREHQRQSRIREAKHLRMQWEKEQAQKAAAGQK